MKKENDINLIGSPKTNLIVGITCFVLCLLDATLIIIFPKARNFSVLTLLGLGFIVGLVIGTIYIRDAVRAYKNKKKGKEFIEYIFG